MSDELNNLDYEPDKPTPEQEEEWKRERLAREAAKIAPYLEIAQAMKDRDDLLADLMMEITEIELEG